MSTLAALVSKLRDYMKVDPNDKIWSTAVKESAVKTAYFQLQKDGNFNWPENEAVTSFNLVGGTQEYAFSTYVSDLIRLDQALFSDTSGSLLPTTKGVVLSHSPSSSGRPSNYYLFNNKIGFYPTPDSAYAVTLQYRKRLPTLTSVISSAFNEDYDDAIVMYAAYILWRPTKNQSKTGQALDDYGLALNRLKLSYLFQDSAQLSFPYQRMSASSRHLKYDPKILR